MLTAIIHKEEDMYVAECPEIGTVSQGKTIVIYLEEFLPEKEHPFLTTISIWRRSRQNLV